MLFRQHRVDQRTSAISQRWEELSLTYGPRFPACRVTSSRTPLFASAIAREGTLADSEPRGSGTLWMGFMYHIGEQSHALRGSVNNRSLLRNFRTFNFHRSGHWRKFYNDQNFLIYGRVWLQNVTGCSSEHAIHLLPLTALTPRPASELINSPSEWSWAPLREYGHNYHAAALECANSWHRRLLRNHSASLALGAAATVVVATVVVAIYIAI